MKDYIIIFLGVSLIWSIIVNVMTFITLVKIIDEDKKEKTPKLI